MDFTEQVFQSMVIKMSPDDLQTLLGHDKIWKMFKEKAELSRDEAKELYATLKKFTANGTMQDQKRLQEDILAMKKLVEVFPRVKAEFESCIQKLHDLAKRVDKVHKGCTVSNVVTSSVGAASGVMSLAGLALAPFTVGGSLLLSAAGTGLGAATAVSGFATTVVEESGIYTANAEAERILPTSKDNMNRLLSFMDKTVFEFFEKVWNFIQKVKGTVKSIRALRKALSNPGLAHDAIRFITTGGLSAQKAEQVQRVFRGTALPMTRAAGMWGVAKEGLCLGLNVYYIVKDAKHLHEGAKAALAEELRQKAQELGEELEELKEILGLCS